MHRSRCDRGSAKRNYHWPDLFTIGTSGRGHISPIRSGRRMMLYQFTKRACCGGLILMLPIIISPQALGQGKGKNRVPPSVTLAAPTNGEQFTAPADITLSANASDTDGTIKKVEFFQGTTLLGTDYTPPYTVTWKAVGPGSYTLAARATDNVNLKTTSIAATINVQGATP